MKLLELFSGTGSVGRAFAARGWEVVSLDSDPRAEPTICQDILTWKPEGRYDMIWASPVCSEHSRAMTRRPRNLEAGDCLARCALEIIRKLRPRFWAVENLQTGLLKTRPFMYRKATRIWTNLGSWEPRAVCRAGDRCEAFAGKRHPEMAQRGSSGRNGNSQTQRQLYSMPPALCDELAAAATSSLASSSPPAPPPSPEGS